MTVVNNSQLFLVAMKRLDKRACLSVGGWVRDSVHDKLFFQPTRSYLCCVYGLAFRLTSDHRMNPNYIIKCTPGLLLLILLLPCDNITQGENGRDKSWFYPPVWINLGGGDDLSKARKLCYIGCTTVFCCKTSSIQHMVVEGARMVQSLQRVQYFHGQKMTTATHVNAIAVDGTALMTNVSQVPSASSIINEAIEFHK